MPARWAGCGGYGVGDETARLGMAHVLVCCRALGSELRDLGWYRQLYRLLASSGSTQLYCSQLRGAKVLVDAAGRVVSWDEAVGSSGGLVLGSEGGGGESGGRTGQGAAGVGWQRDCSGVLLHPGTYDSGGSYILQVYFGARRC